MAAGGKRPGAGRKSKWNHAPTKMMGRFPAIFEEQISQYARELDSESDSNDFDSNSKLTDLADQYLMTVRPSHRKLAAKWVRQFLRYVRSA